MICTRTLASKLVPRSTIFSPGGGVRTLSSPAYRRFLKKQGFQTKPGLAQAYAMPGRIEEFDNGTLITVAAMENHGARIEVLKRHIMKVDDCTYDEACNTFDKIAAANREGMWMAALPYKIGIATGIICAFGSLPMVFDINTALPFNEAYVTTDVPENQDLETMLEVGSWTWNWMEPPLGTLSFALLSLQFSRYSFQSFLHC